MYLKTELVYNAFGLQLILNELHIFLFAVFATPILNLHSCILLDVMLLFNLDRLLEVAS